MRIIVSDGSCMVDLKKASLLQILMGLPYEILIPNTLFEDELLGLTGDEKRALLESGMQVVDLPGERVVRARQIILANRQLSVHDGFALALAEVNAGSILLTGDAQLRTLASSSQIEVRGVLWIVEEILEHQLSTKKILRSGLSLLATDPAVRLPRRALAALLKRFED